MAGHIDEDALAAYLCNTLSPAERDAVNDRLAVDAEARALFVMAFEALSASKTATQVSVSADLFDRTPQRRSHPIVAPKMQSGKE